MIETRYETIKHFGLKPVAYAIPAAGDIILARTALPMPDFFGSKGEQLIKILLLLILRNRKTGLHCQLW
jgi:hypothetical protein